MEPVPIADQIACVEREIRLREKVYPRWVKTQKLTGPVAELELARMRAVLETLQVVAEGGIMHATPLSGLPQAPSSDVLRAAVEAERERVIALVAPAIHSSRMVRLAAKIRGTPP